METEEWRAVHRVAPAVWRCPWRTLWETWPMSMWCQVRTYLPDRRSEPFIGRWARTAQAKRNTRTAVRVTISNRLVDRLPKRTWSQGQIHTDCPLIDRYQPSKIDQRSIIKMYASQKKKIRPPEQNLYMMTLTSRMELPLNFWKAASRRDPFLVHMRWGMGRHEKKKRETECKCTDEPNTDSGSETPSEPDLRWYLNQPDVLWIRRRQVHFEEFLSLESMKLRYIRFFFSPPSLQDDVTK